MQTPQKRLEVAYNDLLVPREGELDFFEVLNPPDSLQKVMDELNEKASPNPLKYEGPIEDDLRVELPEWLKQFLGRHVEHFKTLPERVVKAMNQAITKGEQERKRRAEPGHAVPAMTNDEKLWAVANNFGMKFGSVDWNMSFIVEYGPDFLKSRLPLANSLSCYPLLPRVQRDLVAAFDAAVRQFGLQEDLLRVQAATDIPNKNNELNKVLLPALLSMLEQGYSLRPALAS